MSIENKQKKTLYLLFNYKINTDFYFYAEEVLFF